MDYSLMTKEQLIGELRRRDAAVQALFNALKPVAPITAGAIIGLAVYGALK